MSDITVEDRYSKTVSFSKGLERELNDTVHHNRFKVLQKHIRFHVLNLLVQKYAENGMDLKYFILHNHYEEDQLSQRDITMRLKRIIERLDDNVKIQLLKQAIDEIWLILKEIHIIDHRDRIDSVLQTENDGIGEHGKQILLDKAIGDDFEGVFLERLKSFDQKTIANFITVFDLSMRGQSEKNNGKSCKKKLAKHRKKQNGEMWSDPDTRMTLCQAMRDAWATKRNGNAHPEQNSD